MTAFCVVGGYSSVYSVGLRKYLKKMDTTSRIIIIQIGGFVLNLSTLLKVDGEGIGPDLVKLRNSINSGNDYIL